MLQGNYKLRVALSRENEEVSKLEIFFAQPLILGNSASYTPLWRFVFPFYNAMNFLLGKNQMT